MDIELLRIKHELVDTCYLLVAARRYGLEDKQEEMSKRVDSILTNFETQCRRKALEEALAAVKDSYDFGECYSAIDRLIEQAKEGKCPS